MNKRGVGSVIFFFGLLFIILVVGFIVSIGITIIDFGSDEITPVLEDLGVVGPANVSQAAIYSVGTVDNFIQALPWIAGFAYVFALVGMVGFALGYQTTANPLFIGLFVLLAIFVIMGAILMSNMYENIYTSDNEIGDRLKEQTLLSYMILYSPSIMTVIAFLSGIFLFAGRQNEGGGFNV